MDVQLRYIYINIVNHVVDARERKNFEEYMAEEGIEIKEGMPLYEEDAGIPLEEWENGEGVLVITDCDELYEGIAVAMVGYGANYDGSAKYVIESLDVWVSYLKMAYARYMEQPFVVAETERLIIREMTMDDLPKMYELYESIKDCPYVELLYDWDEEYDFCQKYIENMYAFFGYGLWLAFEKETGELVGRVGIENRTIDGELCRELGYLIRRDKQGKGYAKEALETILQYAARDLCLKEIFVCTHKDNVPSIAIAGKLGFEEYAMDIDGMNLYKKRLGVVENAI